MEGNKISKSRYNKKYKVLGKVKSKYLMKEYIDKHRWGDEIRALVRVRCSNLEEANKYWLKEEERENMLIL